ncbi:PaaI family thioesterase [Desulfobulbus propionicus]
MIINPAVLTTILNIRDQNGFGCGEDNPVGLKMQFLTDNERIYSQVTVPLVMAGWDRTVHGGIISTIMDEIMGRAVIYLLQKIAVTKSLTVDFIKPLYVGRELNAVGSIQEIQSERQALVTGEIYSDGDTLCAKAYGNFSTMSPESAVRLGVMSSEYMEGFMSIRNQNG